MKHGSHKIAVLAAIVTAAALAASPTPAAEPPRPQAVIEVGADIIALDKAQIASLGIRFAVAAVAKEYLLATLPGSIAPPPNARVAVAATFPGTVLQSLAVEGQAVRKGEALATIASRDILAHAADLAQARARFSVAHANAERLEKLSREGIVAGIRVDEAESARAQAEAEVSGIARILAGVNADGPRGTYTLTAPIDGVISSAKIQAGQPVEGMSAPFVVDSGASYEIQAQIPERLVGGITPGMRVTAGPGIEARVTSAGRVIQPETRSALLKALITPGTAVVSGKVATVSVYAPAPPSAVVVPKTAVTELNGRSVVFAQTVSGLAVRDVTTAGNTGGDVVVLAGLRPGEPVAVSGLSELKAIVLSR
jgi:cobalt-zinc-cadmium efflux system membrane fusion protein